MDVILQAGARMEARQIHGAGRHQKMLVNQMDEAIGEAGREVGAEIERSIFDRRRVT